MKYILHNEDILGGECYAVEYNFLPSGECGCVAGLVKAGAVQILPCPSFFKVFFFAANF